MNFEPGDKVRIIKDKLKYFTKEAKEQLQLKVGLTGIVVETDHYSIRVRIEFPCNDKFHGAYWFDSSELEVNKKEVERTKRNKLKVTLEDLYNECIELGKAWNLTEDQCHRLNTFMLDCWYESKKDSANTEIKQ